MTVDRTGKEEAMDAQRIEGAVALVTGADRGIGQALRSAPDSGREEVYATEPSVTSGFICCGST
jgi:hypothetical protein